MDWLYLEEGEREHHQNDMESLRQKGTRKTETVYSVYVETYRDKRAGEHREDIGGGQKDCNEQSPVQS